MLLLPWLIHSVNGGSNPSGIPELFGSSRHCRCCTQTSSEPSYWYCVLIPQFLSALLPKAPTRDLLWGQPLGCWDSLSLLLFSHGGTSVVNHLHMKPLLGNPAEDDLQKHLENLQVKHTCKEFSCGVAAELTVQILHYWGQDRTRGQKES